MYRRISNDLVKEALMEIASLAKRTNLTADLLVDTLNIPKTDAAYTHIYQIITGQKDYSEVLTELMDKGYVDPPATKFVI